MPLQEPPNLFRHVHSILVDIQGKVYVCDREKSRIRIFSLDGHFLATWGDIHRPTDTAMGAEGIFYISEF